MPSVWTFTPQAVIRSAIGPGGSKESTSGSSTPPCSMSLASMFSAPPILSPVITCRTFIAPEIPLKSGSRTVPLRCACTDYFEMPFFEPGIEIGDTVPIGVLPGIGEFRA